MAYKTLIGGMDFGTMTPKRLADDIGDIGYAMKRLDSHPDYHVTKHGSGYIIRNTCGNVVGSIEPKIGALSGPANSGKLSFFDVGEIDNIRKAISE